MIDQTTGREVIEFNGRTQVVTGILSDVVRTATWMNEERQVLTGVVRGDVLDRFPDGMRIHTSFLESEIVKDVFLTRSGNLYRVESWRQTCMD